MVPFQSALSPSHDSHRRTSECCAAYDQERTCTLWGGGAEVRVHAKNSRHEYITHPTTEMTSTSPDYRAGILNYKEKPKGRRALFQEPRGNFAGRAKRLEGFSRVIIHVTSSEPRSERCLPSMSHRTTTTFSWQTTFEERWYRGSNQRRIFNNGRCRCPYRPPFAHSEGRMTTLGRSPTMKRL